MKVAVWEHDEDNAHDHVVDLTGTVQNGKLEISWQVIYTQDNDDSTSAKELAEKGYTLPEYHFVAEYRNIKSKQSPVLNVMTKIEHQVIDKITQKPSSNRNYIVLTPTGKYLKGTTDDNGFIRYPKVELGYYHAIIAKENKE